MPDEGVLEDLEVVLHRGSRHRGVARDRGQVCHLPVLTRGDFKEAAEGADAAGERLRTDFLLQVGLGVSKEIPRRIDAGHGERHAAMDKQVIRRWPKREFCRDQREHLLHDGAARQQVAAAPLELARARPRQHEAQAPPFDQAMNLVEQVRHLLHLVDYHPRSGRQAFHLPVERLRIAAQTKRLARIQQVIGWRSREVVRNPRRLPGASRPEQKEGRGRRQQPSCKHTCNHSCHIYRINNICQFKYAAAGVHGIDFAAGSHLTRGGFGVIFQPGQPERIKSPLRLSAPHLVPSGGRYALGALP